MHIQRCLPKFTLDTTLESLLEDKMMENRQRRNEKIRGALEQWGYSQKEWAAKLKHYSTFSRLLEDTKISKLKT